MFCGRVICLSAGICRVACVCVCVGLSACAISDFACRPRFTVRLFQICRRPSRNKSFAIARVVEVINRVVDHVHMQIEASLNEDWWGESSRLILKPIVRPDRTPHLSMAYKEAVVTASRETAEPLNVRQILGADNMSTSVSDAAGVTISSKWHSAVSKRNHCLGNLAASRAAFDGVRVLHLCFDGVQAAGRHNDVYLALRTDTQEACVPPLKVIRDRGWGFYYFLGFVSRISRLNPGVMSRFSRVIWSRFW